MKTKGLIQVLIAAWAGGDCSVERLQAGFEDRVDYRLSLADGDSRPQPSEGVKPHPFVGSLIVQQIPFRVDTRLQVHRQPQVWLLPGRFTDEAGWRHCRDGEHGVRERDGLAKHVGAASEA